MRRQENAAHQEEGRHGCLTRSRRLGWKTLWLGLVWICGHEMIFCWRGWLLLKDRTRILLRAYVAERPLHHQGWVFPVPPPHLFPSDGKHITEMRPPYSYCFSPPPTTFLYAKVPLVGGPGNETLESVNKCTGCLICSLPKSPFPAVASGSYSKLHTVTLSLVVQNAPFL